MLKRLTRRARKLHNDLMYRTWCSPEHGIVGACDPEHDPFAQHALGMNPVCRCCRREIRRAR